MAAETFLVARGIGKQFGAVTALADVDMEIRRGEVLALLGDNGAGKSTFVKVLAGAHRPSHGELLIEGAPASFASPQDAAQAGIATIYQELALSENLSVAENVYLGREQTRRILGVPFLRRAAMRQRVNSESSGKLASSPGFSSARCGLTRGSCARRKQRSTEAAPCSSA